MQSFISSFLLNNISNYCENINENNLNLGIIEGHILLENVVFKDTLFKDLNLPVIVKHGSVKKFEMIIPWRQLYEGTESVTITIEGKYYITCYIDIFVVIFVCHM